MRYITRPLTAEARARLSKTTRATSPFRSTWTQTLRLLDDELRNLGVRDEFVLQIDVQEADLRLDGQLRANARPASPAVAIAIETRQHGSMLFVCGKFNDWRDNVRAIALGLEALRKVERYGIVQSDEQYRGWQALPPGTPMPAAQMTYEEACEGAGVGGDVESGEPVVAGRVGESVEAGWVPVVDAWEWFAGWWQGWAADPTVEESDDDSSWSTVGRTVAELAGITFGGCDAVATDLSRWYRHAAMRCHPDHGGDPVTFARLVEAKELIEAHRG